MEQDFLDSDQDLNKFGISPCQEQSQEFIPEALCDLGEIDLREKGPQAFTENFYERIHETKGIKYGYYGGATKSKLKVNEFHNEQQRFIDTIANPTNLSSTSERNSLMVLNQFSFSDIVRNSLSSETKSSNMFNDEVVNGVMKINTMLTPSIDDKFNCDVFVVLEEDEDEESDNNCNEFATKKVEKIGSNNTPIRDDISFCTSNNSVGVESYARESILDNFELVKRYDISRGSLCADSIKSFGAGAYHSGKELKKLRAEFKVRDSESGDLRGAGGVSEKNVSNGIGSKRSLFGSIKDKTMGFFSLRKVKNGRVSAK